MKKHFKNAVHGRWCARSSGYFSEAMASKAQCQMSNASPVYPRTAQISSIRHICLKIADDASSCLDGLVYHVIGKTNRALSELPKTVSVTNRPHKFLPPFNEIVHDPFSVCTRLLQYDQGVLEYSVKFPFSVNEVSLDMVFYPSSVCMTLTLTHSLSRSLSLSLSLSLALALSLSFSLSFELSFPGAPY